ncbi:MAG: competence/damage-inducible protein A [Defluviitaleaceae bacterium]|nr:competence/damage-inducible protein A [Defluviitaleaceae bacterium]
MTAEILTVGTEILLGNIVNANAAFLSQGLAGLGISVFKHTSVGDNHGRLAAAFASAFENASLVITTGGLGPTQDDITKSVAAEYFGRELEMHEESRQKIIQRFAGRTLPESVERNALIPQGAEVLPNENGSAPGICMERDGKILIMLPGPPHEMQPMFTKYAAAFLRKKTDSVFVSRTLKIIGMGETSVESQLRDLIDAQTNPTIAPYAKVGDVHVRITASAPDEKTAQALIAPVAEEIYTRLNPCVYGEDETPLAETVINQLKNKNHTLAVAESCTGGLIASNLVAVSGCSAILKEGFVTYSNEAKIARLSVPESLIKEHGAVSPEVAAAMAENAAKVSGATIGLSITGIAGPEGGTPEKPVGLVYIGLHINGQTQTAQHKTIGNRNEIRTRSALLALDLLRRSL